MVRVSDSSRWLRDRGAGEYFDADFDETPKNEIKNMQCSSWKLCDFGFVKSGEKDYEA